MSHRYGCNDLCRRGALLALATLFVCSPPLVAQSVVTPSAQSVGAEAKLKEYDVVSIKENKGNDGMVRMMNTPDGIATTNINLNSLISSAYGVRFDLISGGPDWVRSRGFDVEAKVAGSDIKTYKNLSETDRLAMMKAFLKERFGLRAHIETKELQVYDLAVADRGLKMRLAPPDPSPTETLGPSNFDANPKPAARHNGTLRMSMGTMSGTGLGMMQIARQLSYIVNHPVRDKTGLDGNYDLELRWADEDAPKQDSGDAETAPSIFTAVQEQLGLKLMSTKGPVDTLVIDHVEMPSEN